MLEPGFLHEPGSSKPLFTDSSSGQFSLFDVSVGPLNFANLPGHEY